jgi:hypothetical protein
MKKTRKKRSPIWAMPSEDLRRLVSRCSSLGEVLKEFDLPNIGGNPRTLKDRLDVEGIDYSHIPLGLGSNKGVRGGQPPFDLKEVMVENSTYSRYCLKKQLIRKKVLPYRCAECEQVPFWNGKPLTMILDHINGKRNDHRQNNLRFLCPNCNTQTETFAGKNNKRA